MLIKPSNFFRDLQVKDYNNLCLYSGCFVKWDIKTLMTLLFEMAAAAMIKKLHCVNMWTIMSESYRVLQV